jgi:hypothetical protein
MLNNYDDSDEDFEELNFEEEAEILNAAYENTYLIVTKQVTIEEMLRESLETGDFLFLPFDPSNPDTIELILDDVIAYFEDCEEYEKCAELVAAKKEFENDAR